MRCGVECYLYVYDAYVGIVQIAMRMRKAEQEVDITQDRLFQDNIIRMSMT
jgi:hypothetical protein